MAAPQAHPEHLSPEFAGRLAEFAKACKAATRIVSMYPATHPAIQSALARIGEATRHATMSGPFSITVLPDALLVNGRGLPSHTLDVSARPITGRARQKARPAPVRSARQRDR